MKNSKMMLLISIVALAIGAFLLKADVLIPSGIPYIFMAIGCGLFGKSTGDIYENHALKNDAQAKKQKEIEEKDERNVQIQNLAKAKAYDLMPFAIGALMLAFGLMNENLRVVISLVAVYVFIHIYSILWRFRLDKEM